MKNVIDELELNFFKKRDKSISAPKDIEFPADDNYIYLLKNYLCGEIYPDVDLFSYDEFIKENKELKLGFKEVSEEFIIGNNGQGDSWFLSRDGVVFFYDHNDGEYELENFQNLNVNFIDFLKITLIIKKYEEDLDSEIQQKKFIKELNSVKEGIYDIFPYAYF
ncbi:hypothetical protein G9F32_16425 [Acinetobacter sp. 194]|uniref:hypothetical protein n=1 Tax=Acinetobacter shaoyimingii TaxID=2715164 RepID=UPI00140BD696|nr:hypothetical protein [Acinetobacter shaoyimingii]NHB59581.1 hypothetical protein [Acinetobacter shaoyimingii]